MKITIDTAIDEIKKLPVFAETAELFQGRCDGQTKDEDGKTFRELNKAYPTWNPDSMIYGVEEIEKLYTDGKDHVYPVYRAEETARVPAKENVKLLYYPGDPDKPFVVVIAGGAYMSVCSLSEAFPTAAAFYEEGYNAFVLNYRTNVDPFTPYFPMPVDDLAAAIGFIISHRKELGLVNMHYAVAGFSAGGNLTNTWGLESVGYAKYGLPKPDLLFCNYSVIDLLTLEDEHNMLLSIMFGKDHDRHMAEKYDIASNMTEEYPPCYITAALNDDTVPVVQSKILEQRLSALGIAHESEYGESGGHGYGDGRGTPLYGWIQRGTAFWERLLR